MGAESKEVMDEFAEGRFHPKCFPAWVLDYLPLDRVDEYMAGFPTDVHELVIASVQELYASGTTLIRARPDTPEARAQELALCDWVRRQGRYHYPRRPDEPDIDECSKRLGEPEGKWSRMRREPWKVLRYPLTIDHAMASMPAETREAVIAWGTETFANVEALPTPRPWGTRVGREEQLVAWLRAHGHLPGA